MTDENILNNLDRDTLKIVNEGRASFEKFPEQWDKIKEKFELDYHDWLKDRMIDSWVDRNKKKIQESFEKAVVELLKSKLTKFPSFNEFRIHSMLDQAKELLEQTKETQRELFSMNIASFYLAQEIAEFNAVDKIHDEEVENGFYNLDYDHAVAMGKAEDAKREKFLYRQARYDKFLNWMNEIKDSYGPRIHQYKTYGMQLANLLSSLPWGKKEFDADKQKYSFEQINDNKHNLASMSSSCLGEVNGQEFDLRYADISQSLAGEIEESTIRSEQLKKKIEYELKNIQWKKNRVDVARKFMKQKEIASIKEGGELNYKERINVLEEVLQQGYKNLLVLMQNIYLGLSTLVSADKYKDPPFDPLVKLRKLIRHDNLLDDFQYISNVLNKNPVKKPSLEELHNWLHQVSMDFYKFSEQEQGCILPLSLKQLVNSEKWKHVIDGSKLSIQFEIDDQIISNSYKNVRLRGISCYLPGDTKGIWKAVITPPEKSYIIHYDQEQKVGVDQSFIAAILNGRVGSKIALEEPDVVGVKTLHNVCPYGSWNVTLEGVCNSKGLSTADETLSDISDIILELHLVYILR